MQLAAEVAEQRAALVGERGREASRRIERLGDPEELRWIETPAARGTLGPRPDVVGRPDADAGAVHEERPGLVRLVEAPRDEHRVAAGDEGLGEPPAGLERRRDRQ